MKKKYIGMILYLGLVFLVLTSGTVPIFGQTASKSQLMWGPVLGLVTADAASIKWKSDSVCQSRFFLDDNPFGTVISTGTFHQITLEGLKEDSSYKYRIELVSSAGVTQTQVFNLTTPKKVLPEWNFVVFGDTRTNDNDHKNVIAAVQKASPKPQFVIHTGDFVENGFMPEEWNNFFAIEGALIRNDSFIGCLGNHDRESPNFFNMFFNPLSFDKQSLGYYSFNFSNALFIVLDSEVNFQDQAAYLEQILSKADNTPDLWKFVIWHRGPFSSGSDGGNALLAKVWVPIMEKHHVQCGFYGHNHLYEHSFANGVNHVVSGGGGAPLYQINHPNPYSVKAISKLHYMNIHVTSNELTIQAVTPQGEILDQFKVAK
ncbi:MAG: metallophosphoesterase family protein [Candidatus Riflebacteria bacterium]|nr:metallophosphoesterase family protein [Candidatus Riflebacteria bacterium]